MSEKKEKKGWEKCEHCAAVMTKQELGTHRASCSSVDPWSLEKGFRDGLLFPHDGNLRAVLRLDSGENGSGVPVEEGWLATLGMARLHPATMRVMGLSLLEAVEVSSESGAHCGMRVWPDASLRRLSIALSSAATRLLRPASPLTLLQLAKFQQPLPMAVSLTLTVNSPSVPESLVKKPIFSVFTSAFLSDAVLSKESGLVLRYFGTDIVCTINHVDVLIEEMGSESAEDTLASPPPPLRPDEATLISSISSLSVGNNSALGVGNNSYNSPPPPRNREPPVATSTPMNSVIMGFPPSTISLDSLSTPSSSAVQDTFFRCSSSTLVRFVTQTARPSSPLTLDKCVGGLSDVKAALRRYILEAEGGRKGVRSLLLHGESGTGKSRLIQTLGANRGCSVVRDPSEISASASDSLVLLDSLDDLLAAGGGKRETGELQLRLQRLLDDVEAEGRRLVAATTALHSLPLQLRRRFHLELEVSVPLPSERGEILRLLGQEMGVSLEEEAVEEVARTTHSYTGADLAALLRLAASDSPQPLGLEHIRKAMRRIQPSAMKHISLTVPRIHWSDIAGQETLKTQLKQCIEWPLRRPELFSRMNVKPPRGILLYGPPGCSKTMIARAVATESGLNFLSVKGPELFSKWVGESERGIRELFSKARRAAPSVVFFDEIDALGGSRDYGGGSNVGERVLAQLLTEMDGLEAGEGLVVIAATNRPDALDPALTRPGRLDRALYVPLPDLDTRLALIGMELGRMPHVEGLDQFVVANETEGYSGAEIVALFKEAAMAAITEQMWSGSAFLVPVNQDHITAAFRRVIPRTKNEHIALYEAFGAR